MPPVNLAFAASKRTGFPEVATVNCFPERAQTEGGALALLARPGLEAFETVGSAPIRGICQRPGLLSDAALIIADTAPYTLTSSAVSTLQTGTVAGTSRVDMDGGQDADLNAVFRIATGSKLYKYQDGSVTDETATFGDSVSGAESVCYHRGYWIAQQAGTDQFYTLNPGDTAWDPLSFATAEYKPDPGVAVRSRGDQVWFLNSVTTEVWTLSGDASNPIQPYGGLNFDFGCRARDSAVNCQGSLIWVDNNCAVRMSEGGDASIISDNGLSEQIRRVDAMDLRASTYAKDQHVFYVLTLGSVATWVYDLSTQSWVRYDSLSQDYWRVHLFANIGDLALGCDVTSNQVWKLDPDRRTDGDSTFTVQFCGFAPAKEGRLPCANVILDCEVGDAPLSGQGSVPLIGLQWSDDQGKTWSATRFRSLGATGHYNAVPRWNALGTIPRPHGRVFRWYVSDPVGRRFSGAMMNIA